MKISELYGGQNQDNKIELRQKVLDFRQLIYANSKLATDPEVAQKNAMVAVFALLGMAENYNPCCVFEFCRRFYLDEEDLHPISLGDDGRVMCPQCEIDDAPMGLDTPPAEG